MVYYRKEFEVFKVKYKCLYIFFTGLNVKVCKIIQTTIVKRHCIFHTNILTYVFFCCNESLDLFL